MCSQDIKIETKQKKIDELSKYQVTANKKDYQSSVEILLEGKNIIATSTTRVMEGGVSAIGEVWKKWY